MKQILVPGGAGGVGEAIVRALLAAGHRVIVPSRNAERLARLRHDAADASGLVTLVGEIGTHAGARAIRDRLATEFGPIDAVIPSLGGWWEGALIDVVPAEWDAVMDEMLRSHYVVANVFVPVLRAQQQGGRYIGIGGGAAYRPVRGSSLVSIAAAAQLMMTRALRLEIPDAAVGIIELVVDGAIRTRDSAAIAEDHWITSDEVAAIVADLVVSGTTSDAWTQTDGPIVHMRPRRERSPD
jgi:NAD(P)-dependent dehydrogenase (short-subunit alcohol dehydrogenase family)